MRCIFCGQDSSQSKSVEHIIPESFGNSTAILPKGIVCDKCNNYFARKVEGPFLNSEAVRNLRQELEIENKEGKTITSFAYPRTDKDFILQVDETHYIVGGQAVKNKYDCHSAVARYQHYMDKTDSLLLVQDIYTSRLLAKIALESFVLKAECHPEVCSEVLENADFQPLRMYARYGSRKIWPYSVRRIYPRNADYQDDIFSHINWEHIFLFLGTGEIYSVIAMHGIEYVINLGGPEIDGYKEWLHANNNKSPLYLTNDEYRELVHLYKEKVHEIMKEQEQQKEKKSNDE
jgi:hypothetical protein